MYKTRYTECCSVQQLVIDREVLQVIAKTRAELRAIRARYAAMRAAAAAGRVAAEDRYSDLTPAQHLHSKGKGCSQLCQLTLYTAIIGDCGGIQ